MVNKRFIHNDHNYPVMPPALATFKKIGFFSKITGFFLKIGLIFALPMALFYALWPYSTALSSDVAIAQTIISIIGWGCLGLLIARTVLKRKYKAKTREMEQWDAQAPIFG